MAKAPRRAQKEDGTPKTASASIVAAAVMAAMLLAVLMPAISPGAAAAPAGPDPKAQLDKRALQVTNDSGSYTIRSSIVIKGVEDSFKVEFRLGEDLELALKYKESAPELEHRIDVTLKFRNLIEFDDRNGNGRYDPGEELQRYDISNRSLNAIEYRTERIGTGALVHVLSTSTLDQVFFVRFYMTGELTSIKDQGSAVNVTPSEVKFDLNIRHFPFRENSSRLAVDGQLITRENLTLVNQTLDEKLNVAADESGCVFNDADNVAGAFLSWANWARIDGQDRPVQMDIPPAENANGSRRLSINYPRGDDIFHDPRMGIVMSSIGARVAPVASGGIGTWAWTIGIVAVAGTAASIAGVAVVRDRRRFQKHTAQKDPFELGEYPFYRGKR